MRKSTIALAVAAALGTAAAQADTTLYGSARVSVDYQKADLLTDTFEEAVEGFDFENDGTWDVVNNSSRLGVRGFEDLGNGLSAIYQFEFGVDVTDGGNLESNRPKLVGLKHDRFGTLSIGTQWTPYYNVAGITDVFNSGKTFGSTAYLGRFRKDNTLNYLSPNWYGFTAEAQIQMNGPGGQEDSIDTWDAAIRYQNGPIFAGVGYTSTEGDDVAVSAIPTDDLFTLNEDTLVRGSRDQWVLGLGYTYANFALGFTGEYGDDNQFGDNVVRTDTGEVIVDGDTAWNYYGTLSYTFGANIVRAAYGYVDPDGDADEFQNYALGFQHNLSNRTRLWVEYIGQNSDEELSFEGDADAISLGVRHDF